MIRIGSLLGIALIYMLFDVFNNRNVPSIFAYATLVYGAALTVLYLNLATIEISAAIAAVVLALGYVVYKIGQLGAADFIEIAALSLIMPIQQSPMLTWAPNQLGLPFVISVMVNAGVVALIFVPLYYLGKAMKHPDKPLRGTIGRGEIMKGMTILVAYAAFAIVLFYLGSNIVGIAVIVVIAIGSLIVILMERAITRTMVSYVHASKLQPEDMLAFNIMSSEEVKRIKHHIHSFNRLITPQMLKEFREKNFDEKLPVYTNALPLALPLFIAVVIALLAGNLILLILPFR
jgi:hypothetical protein